MNKREELLVLRGRIDQLFQVLHLIREQIEPILRRGAANCSESEYGQVELGTALLKQLEQEMERIEEAVGTCER